MNNVTKQAGFFSMGAVMLIFAFSAGSSMAIDSLLTANDTQVVEQQPDEQVPQQVQITLSDDDA